METVWELDFYSRPIVDAQQKRIWEVLVCDTQRTFAYAKFCPGNQVNSTWLQSALQEAISKAPQAPEKIRFFRRQMNNIITRACEALEIVAQPSRRTFALNHWLQQRNREVYPAQPGFQPLAVTPARLDTTAAQPLPQPLIGQQWAFVTLAAGELEEMDEWAIDFSESFPLQMLQLAPETPIPGVVIFSPRARPLAGWMSG
ncbi:MAG TPA: Tab2/Atab2 family RNA-binding protein, partial [Candidatus Caenarcaniphilales bacterium]